MTAPVNPLIRLIPPPMVRLFARPYVAGDSLSTAVDTAATLLQERKLLSTLDLLAEGIRDERTAHKNEETYSNLLDHLSADTRFDAHDRPSVSLKFSSYTTHPLDHGGDARGALDAVMRIVEHAAERHVQLTVDMEDRHWTDFTLKAMHKIFEQGHRHVGTVLQSRLHRTAQDIERLPQGCRVRLVIGIYEEPSSVALTSKRKMKDKLLEYAHTLLTRGHPLEFGTHDEAYVRRFLDEVVPSAGVGPDKVEIQMLYGVPREALLREIVERGFNARLYVPFALGWSMAIDYLRRRLDEYPAMMFLVAKNLLSRG